MVPPSHFVTFDILMKGLFFIIFMKSCLTFQKERFVPAHVVLL